MFGIIVSSRPVDAAPQAITPTQYAFRIASRPSFSHIVVFLLPGSQLPPDTAATVYVQIPPSQEFRLLGGLGPGKESAIFKISGLKGAGGVGSTEPSGNDDVDLMTDDNVSTDTVPQGDIVVGISIEPASQVDAQLRTLNLQQSPVTSTTMVKSSQSGVVGAGLTTKVLAQRIIGNAFNFLASFGSETIPLKAFQAWWDKFEKKIELDPGFLEREQ